jgi:FixJ family two-component response regulator
MRLAFKNPGEINVQISKTAQLTSNVRPGLVDDEESVRKAVVRVLRAAGFAARGFASGEEFLKSRQFDQPDCLVLDLQMPGLSGAQVQQALKVARRNSPSSS